MSQSNVFAIIPDRIFSSLKDGYDYDRAVIVNGKEIDDIVNIDCIPESLPRFTYKDCTLLPGLIDAHCHLEDWAAPMYLSYGITTVRDTGNELKWILTKRAEMENPEALGPSIVCCGPLLDGKQYIHPVISWGIEKDEDLPLAIECLQNYKVDAIKLYVGLGLKKIRIAVEECAKRGIHLLGHFQGIATLFDAVKAEVPEVEHFYEIPSYYSEEIVNEIIERKTWVVPSQMVWEGILVYNSRREEVTKYMENIPEGLVKVHMRQYWEKTIKSDPNLEKVKTFCKNNREYIKGMIQHGGRILPGTDAPCQLSLPGLSYFDELQVFSDCGMSNSAIIKCATVTASSVLGISGKAGTIEKGKEADMLIIEGDPLKDLKSLRSIKYVFKKGCKHIPNEILRKANPEGMPTNHLPDMGKMATEFYDWKEKYLNCR